jgi:hypothetical protein
MLTAVPSASSPLANVRKYLSVLSWFGFPLRQDSKAKQTTFVVSMYASNSARIVFI